jgi:hypothetical protein
MDKQQGYGLTYPPMPGNYAMPYYVQSPPYPLLMNPPNIPTVSRSKLSIRIRYF